MTRECLISEFLYRFIRGFILSIRDCVFMFFILERSILYISIWYSSARVFDLIKVLLKNVFSYDLRSWNAFDLEFKQNYLSINLVGSLKPHVLKLRA